MKPSIVIMGVAGCGKSSLAAALAASEGLPLIEGDDFHSEESRSKMTRGTPLDDHDRAGWLAALGEELLRHVERAEGVVLSCSALKRSYRDALRRAVPALRFVYLEVDRAAAEARVAQRAAHAPHFFSTRLVASQFETLEPPLGEAGVLHLDGRAPPLQLHNAVQTWLREEAHA
jgi:gluconokinase